MMNNTVYRVRRPRLPEGCLYSVREMAQMHVGYLPQGSDDWQTEELRPYCEEIRVNVREIDLKKIMADYHLSQKAHIHTCSRAGDVGICDPDCGNQILALSRQTLEKKYLHSHVENFLVYQREPVISWHRKDDISEFFRDLLDYVENSGFYCLQREHIRDYNETARLCGWERLPEEAPTKDTALFYQERF